MEWLKIQIKEIESHAFLLATDTQRATWLLLLSYCAKHENGGRISGCRSWTESALQAVIRVKLRVILTECGLWCWEGDDLLVSYYPQGLESNLQHKRKAGSAGGKKRAEHAADKAKQTTSTNDGLLEADSTGLPSSDPGLLEAKEADASSKSPTLLQQIDRVDRVEERVDRVEKTHTACACAGEREVERTLPPLLEECREIWENWVVYRTELNQGRTLPQATWDAHLRVLEAAAAVGGAASVRESVRRAIAGGLRQPVDLAKNSLVGGAAAGGEERPKLEVFN